MKKILAISGSAAAKSSNTAFLQTLQGAFRSVYQIEIYTDLRRLPLFSPDLLQYALVEEVYAFKESVKSSEAIIICTPEYNHNIPAVLKNGLEWTSASGEFSHKKVLPITLTPHAPRGEWAMQSLLFTLKSMEAIIPVQLSMYKNDFTLENDQPIFNKVDLDMWHEALALL